MLYLVIRYFRTRYFVVSPFIPHERISHKVADGDNRV